MFKYFILAFKYAIGFYPVALIYISLFIGMVVFLIRGR